MTHLHDNLFFGQSALHASGDRMDARPAVVSWQRLCSRPVRSDTIWFTDGQRMDECAQIRGASQLVRWMVEPRVLHPENYNAVEKVLRSPAPHWPAVFTHDSQLLQYAEQHMPGAPVYAYPHGGTRIHPSDWREWEKTKGVSIVASPKRSMPGHKLRHQLIEHFRGSDRMGVNGQDKLDVYGPEYTPINRKLQALAPYQFSVAIENSNDGLWFTEALLDCFLTFTIPIWWGSPDAIKKWGFNPDGMKICSTLDDLIVSVNYVSLMGASYLHAGTAEAMYDNFVQAHEYTCTEDWLHRHYPELFDEVAP